jgi:WD40 repeat protein
VESGKQTMKLGGGTGELEKLGGTSSSSGGAGGAGGAAVVPAQTGHTKGVRTLAYSARFRFLLSAGFDFCVYVWNPYVNLLIMRLPGHAFSLVSVRVVPDTPQLISADESGVLKVWDIRTFACVQTLSNETHALANEGSGASGGGTAGVSSGGASSGGGQVLQMRTTGCVKGFACSGVVCVKGHTRIVSAAHLMRLWYYPRQCWPVS